MGLTILANEILLASGVPLPVGQPCQDTDVFEFAYAQRRNNLGSKYYTIIDKTKGQILPDVGRYQGYRYDKPERYVAMAVAMLGEEDTIETAIEEVLKVSKDILKRTKLQVEKAEPIRDSKVS